MRSHNQYSRYVDQMSNDAIADVESVQKSPAGVNLAFLNQWVASQRELQGS